MADDRLQMHVVDGSRPAETVIELEGVLNAETAFQFLDFVLAHDAPTLVIDMSRVRFWDLFRICKIEGVFHRYSTVADAEQAVPASAVG